MIMKDVPDIYLMTRRTPKVRKTGLRDPKISNTLALTEIQTLIFIVDSIDTINEFKVFEFESICLQFSGSLRLIKILQINIENMIL